LQNNKKIFHVPVISCSINHQTLISTVCFEGDNNLEPRKKYIRENTEKMASFIWTRFGWDSRNWIKILFLCNSSNGTTHTKFRLQSEKRNFSKKDRFFARQTQRSTHEVHDQVTEKKSSTKKKWKVFPHYKTRKKENEKKWENRGNEKNSILSSAKTLWEALKFLLKNKVEQLFHKPF
jgi:hypothetical protein